MGQVHNVTPPVFVPVLQLLSAICVTDSDVADRTRILLQWTMRQNSRQISGRLGPLFSHFQRKNTSPNPAGDATACENCGITSWRNFRKELSPVESDVVISIGAPAQAWIAADDHL
jgi:hypothetical protein